MEARCGVGCGVGEGEVSAPGPSNAGSEAGAGEEGTGQNTEQDEPPPEGQETSQVQDSGEGNQSASTPEVATHEVLIKDMYRAILDGDGNTFSDALQKLVPLNGNGLNLSEYMYLKTDEVVSELHKKKTLLQLMCSKGRLGMLREFLALSVVDINFRGRYGRTALNLACLYAHLETARELINSGAEVNLCNLDGDCDTALITTAACYQPECPDAMTYLQIGQLLLKHGADANALDKHGDSAIFTAVIKSDSRFTKLLLQYQADVDIVCSKFGSALCCALSAAAYENAKLLLQSGCDTNITSDESKGYLGPTPLHFALVKNNLGMVLALLEAGADPQAFVQSDDLVKYMHNSVLHAAAAEGHLVTLWLLIAKGGNINSQHDFRRDTSLVILARKGSVEGVKMLLRLGADVELESTVGTTALWGAVRGDHFCVVRVLLETCCSVETASMEYHMYMPLTPLEIALRLQLWRMALALLMAGASHKVGMIEAALSPEAAGRGGGGGRLHRARPMYRLAPGEHLALRELRAWKSQPLRLKQICRSTLRAHYTVRLPVLLNRLGYPTRLKNYLFLKDGS